MHTCLFKDELTCTGWNVRFWTIRTDKNKVAYDFFYCPPMFEASSIPFYLESLKSVHEPWLLNQAEKGWGMEEGCCSFPLNLFLPGEGSLQMCFPSNPQDGVGPLISEKNLSGILVSGLLSCRAPMFSFGIETRELQSISWRGLVDWKLYRVTVGYQQTGTIETFNTVEAFSEPRDFLYLHR